ncbi:hypothetical protein A6F58_00550 [Prescottella equi]|nr:hypothetical protein A6F58_00550 [Prescottella equi]
MTPFSGESPFDQIREVRDDGTEFWSARKLMPHMGYDKWQNFQTAIERAKLAAQNSGMNVNSLFTAVSKNSGGRPQEDCALARFAAYLVALNGDPRKPETAAGQSYFVIRAREAETRPQLDPSTPAGVLAMAEQFAATARQLVIESDARKQLEAKVEHDAPLVAKAEAHSASTKAIHRQEFAREVKAWAMRVHGLRVLHQQVFAFLAFKGMTVGGNRSDAGHATSRAVEAGWAWTDKGEAENGHRYATTKLNPKGQDIAWKWITKYIDENGTLELPREITGGTAA